MTIADYDYRLLYDQHCLTEEGVQVLSSIYALSYTYPGALSRSTARLRITCIYAEDSGGMHINGGTIEKWRDGGWSTIDEYCDAREDFDEIESFRKRMLYQAQAFLLGVPMSTIDEDYTSGPPYSPGGSKTKSSKPNLKIVKPDDEEPSDTKGKKETKTSNNYKKDPKPDKPDFDFI
jgi:hypothetical protein